MKICPQCRTSYTDDSLQFCLQDGTPLVGSPTTNNLDESETVISPRQDKMRFDLPYQQNAAGSREVIVAETPRKSNTGLIVTLTALLTLLTAGAGVAGIFYLKRNEKNNVALNVNSKPPANIIAPNVAQNSNINFPVVNANANQNSNSVTPVPIATPIPKPTLNPNEVKEIKSDVENVVEGWNDALENHDLDAHLSKYADSVNYYNAGAASIEKVRADKQRAFEAYDEINLDISNLKVTPDETGEKATAVFDKKWKFEGEDKFSSGKVQQQLQLAKIGGKWRITGEKDLKVYYIDK